MITARLKYQYDTGPTDTIRSVSDDSVALSLECEITYPESMKWRTIRLQVPAEQIPAIYEAVRDLLTQEFRGLFADVSERAVIQAAYDVLTGVGSRSRWQHDLTDSAHQALGVILGVIRAEQMEKGSQ